MAEHIQLGASGEKEACNYLLVKGYVILATNWKEQHLEIDIIALHEKTLVVVEVKTRSSEDFGRPEGFVTRAKQRKLVRAANAFVKMRGLENEIRFDVIAVLSREGKLQIEHLPDAFYPGLRTHN